MYLSNFKNVFIQIANVSLLSQFALLSMFHTLLDRSLIHFPKRAKFCLIKLVFGVLGEVKFDLLLLEPISIDLVKRIRVINLRGAVVKGVHVLS